MNQDSNSISNIFYENYEETILFYANFEKIPKNSTISQKKNMFKLFGWHQQFRFKKTAVQDSRRWKLVQCPAMSYFTVLFIFFLVVLFLLNYHAVPRQFWREEAVIGFLWEWKQDLHLRIQIHCLFIFNRRILYESYYSTMCEGIERIHNLRKIAITGLDGHYLFVFNKTRWK